MHVVSTASETAQPGLPDFEAKQTRSTFGGTRKGQTQQPSNNPNKIEHELSLIWGRSLDGKLVRRRKKGLEISLSKLADGFADCEWWAAVTFRAADARRERIGGLVESWLRVRFEDRIDGSSQRRRAKTQSVSPELAGSGTRRRRWPTVMLGAP